MAAQADIAAGMDAPMPWRCDERVPKNGTKSHMAHGVQRLLPGRIASLVQPYSMAIRKNLDVVSGAVNKGVCWEPMLTSIFADELIRLRNLQGTVNFLDVGTNIGWFTLLAVALNSSVIAIEPNADNVHMLRRSICANSWAPRVRLHQVAAGSASQNCSMISSERNIGDTALVCGDIHAAIKHHTHLGFKLGTPGAVEQRGGPVHVRKLDDVVGTLPIDVVKIDIEGFEGGVLGGWQSIFSPMAGRRVPSLVLSEFFPAAMEKNGFDPRDYLRFFADRGYRVARSSEFPKRMPHQSTPFDFRPFALENASRHLLRHARSPISDLIFFRS